MSSFRDWNGLTFGTDFPGRLGAVLPGSLGDFFDDFLAVVRLDLSWGFGVQLILL